MKLESLTQYTRRLSLHAHPQGRYTMFQVCPYAIVYNRYNIYIYNRHKIVNQYKYVPSSWYDTLRIIFLDVE